VRRGHHALTLVILAVACTSYALQQTAIAPALGPLQRDLHTSSTWATWTVSIFLFAASIATPIIAKLGDQYGKKRLLLISLAVFLVGCLFAMVAWNIWSLLAARALQGTAGALIPLSFAIVRDEFPAGKATSGIGLLSATFGIGGGSGLVIGGLTIDHLSWRWLFVWPAAAIVVGLVLVAWLVPESPVKTQAKTDVAGATLLGLCLGALLLGLTEAEHWGWTSAKVLGLFAASAVLLLVWVRVERLVPEPLIDMDVFFRRSIVLANAVALMLGITMFSTFVSLVLLLETPNGMGPLAHRLAHYGLGYTASQTALLVLPGPAANLVVGPFIGRLGTRFGTRSVVAAGCAVAALGTAFLIPWHHAWWHFVVAQALNGTGIGLTLGGLPALVTESVRQTETGVANGINIVVRQVGLTLGTQLVGVFLAVFTIGHTSVPAERAFVVTFVLATASAAVAAVLAMVTPRARSRHEFASPAQVVGQGEG
jgi:MFS family permease